MMFVCQCIAQYHVLVCTVSCTASVAVQTQIGLVAVASNVLRILGGLRRD